MQGLTSSQPRPEARAFLHFENRRREGPGDEAERLPSPWRKKGSTGNKLKFEWDEEYVLGTLHTEDILRFITAAGLAQGQLYSGFSRSRFTLENHGW